MIFCVFNKVKNMGKEEVGMKNYNFFVKPKKIKILSDAANFYLFLKREKFA